MQVYDVLIRALMSEKSMKDSEKGKYSFLVHRRANKYDVKRAVESVFKVNVVSVLTTTIKGRTNRVGARRIEITKSPFKKAQVTLRAGQTLGATTEEPKSDKDKKKEDLKEKVKK